MKKILNAFLVLTLLISVGCNRKMTSSESGSATITPGVYFQKSKTLSAILDIAEKENKVVFVDMYTDWCLPCKIMDENVFSDETLGNFMNDNFINYKVNTEKGTGPNLRDIYEVISYPTLLFLNSKGNVLVRKEGSVAQTELMELGNQALNLNVAN